MDLHRLNILKIEAIGCCIYTASLGAPLWRELRNMRRKKGKKLNDSPARHG